MKQLMMATLLAACMPAIQAGEVVNLTLDADPRSEVSIDVVSGAIKVVGWDKHAVHVEGTRDDQSEEFIFEREGREIRIEDRLKRRGFGDAGSGTLITVQVPRGSSVVTDVVSADVDVREVSGSARIDTVSGDITLQLLGADAHASTVSGEIKVMDGGGEIHLESVSGDIEASVDAERLLVESVSGSISATNRGSLRRGNGSTVNGDLMLVTALAPDAELDLESVNGDIELRVRGEINARFSLETGPGGDVDNGLTDQKPRRERYTGAEELDLTVGDGGADVRGEVVNGSITLRKE